MTFDELQFNDTELRFYNLTREVRLDNQNASNRIIRVYGANSMLAYFPNGTNPCGINLVSSCNISLLGGNTSFLLNQFNLTVGESRTHSPIWLVSSSGFSQRTLLYELKSPVNLTANLTGYSGVMCFDVDHPEFNDTYFCGTNSLNFIFNMTYFRRSIFNDSSSIKNLTWINGGNQSVFIKAHQYDEVRDLRFNISAYSTNGTVPTNIKIYFNNTLTHNLGIIPEGASLVTLSTVNDSSSIKNYTFSSVPDTESDYFYLFKEATISSAYVNFTGSSYPIDYYNTVYDELNDSVINPDLWENYSLSGGSACSPVSHCVIVEETSDYLRIYSGASYNFQDRANMRTIGFTGTDSINNITMRVAASQNGNAGGIGDIVTISVFGNEIYTAGSVSNPGSSSDDSVWTIVKNTTAGSNRFDVFNDGVLSRQITATSSVIDFQTSANGAGSGTVNQAQILIYYIYHNSNLYPTDPYMEIGTVDGDREFSYTGVFNTTNKSEDFGSVLQNYLDSVSCVANSEGFCYVPFTIGSDTYGRMTIRDINIQYNSNPSPITFNQTLIQNYLGNSTNFTVLPIKIESTQNGTLSLTALQYDYAGGNDTINATIRGINGLCNQEIATAQSCGLAGSYLFGSFGFEENYMYINYSKPTGAANAIWQVKHGSNPAYNVSVPSSCFNYDSVLRVRFYSSHFDAGTNRSVSYGQCLNSTGWSNITNIYQNDGGGSSAGSTIGTSPLIDSNYSTYALFRSSTGNWLYATGYDNMNASIYEESMIWNVTNASSYNDSIAIYSWYSDYYKLLPYTWTENIFFTPRTNSSKNVSAFGQTVIKPILNITNTNYGGRNMSLAIRLNETFACLNITWSQNNTKTNNLLNTSWTTIKNNSQYLERTNVWIWADLNNCNANDRRILNPQLQIDSYCTDCAWAT